MQSIAILEDNVALRLSLEDFFKITGGCYIVFSSGDFQLMQRKRHTIDPDIILLDIHLSGILGTEIMTTLREYFPLAKIIVITGDKSKEVLMDSVKKGACGILYKPFSLKSLNEVIQSVNVNGSFMAPEVLTSFMGLINSQGEAESNMMTEEMSHREKEIFELMIQGHTNQQIAEKINLTTNQVYRSMRHIYKKADVKSRVELNLKFSNL